MGFEVGVKDGVDGVIVKLISLEEVIISIMYYTWIIFLFKTAKAGI